MANFINEKKPTLSNDDHDYDSWDEDNWLEKSWLLNSMTWNACAKFDHCETAYAVWAVARKTYTDT